MDAPVSLRDGLARAMPAPLPDVEPYVLLPEPLALDLRDSDLGIGIYLLVARLYLVHQAPIPLSATDIDAFDGGGTLRRGAILRALDRLCAQGWLVACHRRGQKATYLPAWGEAGGVPRPWDLSAPALGRPRSVRAARVPRIVLDVCMGRLTPHHRHAALITRYVTRPPLSLRDVGAYGLLWAGLPGTSPALTRLSLAGPDGPLPPPSWGTLLARISQHPLFDADPEAPALTPRGAQRVGLLGSAPSASPESAPLFFVPKDLIGAVIPPPISRMIDPPIGAGAAGDEVLSATASAEPPITASAPATAGNQGTRPISGTKATPPPPPPAGGSSSAVALPSTERPAQPRTARASRSPRDLPPAAPAEPATPAELTLRELGMYPSVARQYRDLPPALVERAVTIARRLPGRQSLPATVAQLLREEQVSPGWLKQGRPDLLLAPMHEAASESTAENTGHPPGRAADPRVSIHGRLCAALGAPLSLFIEREQIQLGEGMVAIDLPTWFSDEERAAVDTALQAVAAELGLGAALAPAAPAIPAPEPPSGSAAPPATPAARPERPAWISPEQWGQLHLMSRGALSGTRWEEGEIVGSSPAVTRMLRTHLAGLVARLRAGADAKGPPESTAPLRAPAS